MKSPQNCCPHCGQSFSSRGFSNHLKSCSLQAPGSWGWWVKKGEWAISNPCSALLLVLLFWAACEWCCSRFRDKGAIVEGLVDGGLDVAMLKYVKLNQKYRYLDHHAAAEMRNNQDEKAQWSGYNLGGARPGSSQPQPTTQPQERSGRDPSSSFFASDAT